MLLFDIETNGLLDKLDRVHCIVIKDLVSGETRRYNSQANGQRPIEEGLHLLSSGDTLVGHNIDRFDIPALKKVYPDFTVRGNILDTLVISKTMFPHLKRVDWLTKKWKLPSNMYGRHSLEAWGLRLGYPKDAYQEWAKSQGISPWADWNQQMEDYCVQDVESNTKLFQYFQRRGIPYEAVELERRVAQIIERQEKRGFAVNEAAIVELFGQLQQAQDELGKTIRAKYCEGFMKKDGTDSLVDPKRTSNRTIRAPAGDYKANYEPGCPYNKVKFVEFNPGSGDHVEHLLRSKYGWEPTKFGNNGKATTNEETLSALVYEPIQEILEYQMIAKRAGAVGGGAKSWLNMIKGGAIHGRVDPQGTNTARMSHSNPNITQVARVKVGPDKKPVTGVSGKFGYESRSCWVARPGYVLLGCDAEGLELRGLGHYLARYDGGAFAQSAIEGDKKLGTDSHTMTQKAVGLNSRDSAKTVFYAWMYGAWDTKLGKECYADMTSAQRAKFGSVTDKRLTKLGHGVRTKLTKGLRGFEQLAKMANSAYERGWIKAIDGRKLYPKSKHSTLNLIVQSMGAIVMKRALVICDELFVAQGWVPGDDYEFVLNAHDEFQIEIRPNLAELAMELAKDSIRLAGEYYDLRVPLAGDASVGTTWAETH